MIETDLSLTEWGVAGVDEAGRGPLAGPVVAAAVILNPDFQVTGLADSKLLTAPRRQTLAQELRQRAVAWAIAEASVEEIDVLNILQASLLAMRRAIRALQLTPARVLVDGNYCPAGVAGAVAIVGGDARIAAISAASILAKVHRDSLMRVLHQQYPAYGFDRHFGYATEAHLRVLRRLGPVPCHRRTFRPVREALGLLGKPARELVEVG